MHGARIAARFGAEVARGPGGRRDRTAWTRRPDGPGGPGDQSRMRATPATDWSWRADDAQLVADLAAQEDEGDDGDDGDECKDEGVFREALAILVAISARR